MLTHVAVGSWLCKNALAEATTWRDIGVPFERGHFVEFGDLWLRNRLLLSFQRYGLHSRRMVSAAAMP
jgi:hypothetical protein